MKKITKEQAEKIFDEDFIDSFDIPIEAFGDGDLKEVKSLIVSGICKGRIEFDIEKQKVIQRLKIPIKQGKDSDATLIESIEYSITNCNYGLIKPIQEGFEKGNQIEAIAFFTGESKNAIGKMCNSDALTGFQICAFFFLY